MATFRLCAISNCGKKAHARGWCHAHYQRWRWSGNPLGSGVIRADIGEPLRHLMAHVTHTGKSCLIWPFSRNKHGYGKLRFKGTLTSAHRLMCVIAHGEAPTPKHEVAHSCGNGRLGCFNPEHLRWATRSDNHADKVLHGTAQRGEKAAAAKLTARHIVDIRADMRPQSVIAPDYGISRSNISLIKSRKTWAHIP
jgi:hypothetical protein